MVTMQLCYSHLVGVDTRPVLVRLTNLLICCLITEGADSPGWLTFLYTVQNKLTLLDKRQLGITFKGFLIKYLALFSIDSL